jgi:hypothetical protein
MTGRPCTVCSHPLLGQINEKLVLRSMTLARIADKYDLHPDALRRHRNSHISESERRKAALCAKVAQEEAVADAINSETVEVRSGLQRVVNEIDGILTRAKARGDDPLALMSLREMRTTLLDLAKVYGQLSQELTVTVSLNESPQWLQLREVLFEVFQRHPAAKEDFVQQARSLRIPDGP